MLNHRICFFVGLLLAPIVGRDAHAATIKVSYTYVNDRISPAPQKNLRITNSYDVVLEESGKVSEEVTRSAGPFADGFKNKVKLGDGQWDVVSENQLRRTFDQPQSTLVLTITVTDKTCALEPKFSLKPGFNEYKFRRITDGTTALFTEPKVQSTSCTIK